MPDDADVERFLSEYHGEPPRALTKLTGGFWSAAYAYELGGEELVARFGEMKGGDHLYDTAWCTFWGDHAHAGIAAAVNRSFTDDEAERVRCYELHIATTHLGWYAWTDDRADLDALVPVVSRLTAPA